MYKGGAPERVVSVIMLTATFATAALGMVPGVNFAKLELAIFVIDVVTLVALAGVALTAARLWPLLIAALQLVAIACHIAALLQVASLPWVYAFLLSVWAYPMLLILAIGTWFHSSRVGSTGKEQHWSSFNEKKS